MSLFLKITHTTPKGEHFMKWKDMSEQHRQDAAELIGTIDSGERWIFEYSESDTDFHGLICNKILCSADGLGVISAAYYRDSQRISAAFHSDLPPAAETVTAKFLADLVKSSELTTYIWCKNENRNLRGLIETVFHVSLNYASREMCVSKEEFKAWRTLALPLSYELCGFDSTRHDEYVSLLERGMRHVSYPGTTPYLD